MSKIETNTIAPSTGTTLTLGESGDTVNVGGTAGTGFGKVLQSVSATDTTDRSTTSTTFVTASNTLTLNITPSASSSKVLIMVSTTLYQYTGNKGVYLTIYRDSTNLGNAQGLVRVLDQDSSSGFSGAGTCIVLDSPSTTSQITYQAYIRTDSGGTGAINSNTSGFITALEVSA